MALAAFAVPLLDAVEHQLQPLAALAMVHPLALVAAFILLHAALFFGSYALWSLAARRWPKMEAHVLASSTTAGTHGLVVTAGVISVISAWDWASFDEPNTPGQTLLMLYSVAYFLEDMYYCATLPSDVLMYEMHHIVTAAFIASPLLLGRGGIAIAVGLFTGECTNGLFHSYLMLEQFAKHSRQAKAIHRVWALVFTSVFFVARSIFSWPTIVWYSRKAWAAATVPVPHRILWCATGCCVAAASQGFSLGFIRSTRQLWAEHLAERRQRQAAIAQKAKARALLHSFDSAYPSSGLRPGAAQERTKDE